MRILHEFVLPLGNDPSNREGETTNRTEVYAIHRLLRVEWSNLYAFRHRTVLEQRKRGKMV